MKIVELASKPKKTETPFVVGGVYRFKPHIRAVDFLGSRYRVLIRRDGHDLYAWLDPSSGVGAWSLDRAHGWSTAAQIRETFDDIDYLPNARLVIEE